MKQLRYGLIGTLVALIVVVGGAGVALAGTPTNGSNSNTTIEITDKDLNLVGAPKKVEKEQIQGILNAVYGVVGIVAVISILVGAFRYAAANGDSGIIQSAKNTILYSVIGLVVVISAAALTSFVINNIGKAS